MTEYPNWFESTAKPNFKNYLLPYAGKPDLNFLQVGAYTGDASLWLLENVLTHETSRLTDVDTWRGSDEEIHKEFDWSDVEDTYDKKTEPYKDKITKVKSDSVAFLKNQGFFSYDFIYIDGDHTALGAFADAVGAWPLLKPYGIMAFDDYTWTSGISPEHEPKKGIDKFLQFCDGSYSTIIINNQAWVRSILELPPQE
jgi:predicted O-methyltransferase YrrM